MQVQKKKIRGFTLLEVLVVVVIVGILSAAAYPNFSEWQKDRKTRKAAESIENIFKNMSQQTKQGFYPFSQVLVYADNEKIEITAKGMNQNDYARKINDRTLYKDPCKNNVWETDEKGEDRKIMFFSNKDVMVNFSGTSTSGETGAVCFSKDESLFSASGVFANRGSGELISDYDSSFVVCYRDTNSNSCNSEGPYVGSGYLIEWTRFGNISKYRWSESSEEWISRTAY